MRFYAEKVEQADGHLLQGLQSEVLVQAPADDR